MKKTMDVFCTVLNYFFLPKFKKVDGGGQEKHGRFSQFRIFFLFIWLPYSGHLQIYHSPDFVFGKGAIKNGTMYAKGSSTQLTNKLGLSWAKLKFSLSCQ